MTARGLSSPRPAVTPSAAPGPAPHPLLLHYYASAEHRPAYVRGLFDRSAQHYDRINAVMSFGAGRRYRREMLAEAGLRPGMRVLDVAVGTGQVAREARRLAGDRGLVVGVDVSSGMLQQAKLAGAADELVCGQAEALPFADASFDLVSVGYGLRHVSDLSLLFRELARVLRSGGRLLVLELSRPSDWWSHTMMRLCLGRLLPWISLLSTGSRDAQMLMRYYWDTIDGCVPPEVILAAMRGAGLEEVRSSVQYSILRAYVGCRA